jgi:hypothetical protein
MASSGRKSLVLGCTCQHVVGVDARDSGDLVIRDNAGTMHRAEAYDPTCGRMMHRTKLEGEEPWVE